MRLNLQTTVTGAEPKVCSVLTDKSLVGPRRGPTAQYYTLV